LKPPVDVTITYIYIIQCFTHIAAGKEKSGRATWKFFQTGGSTITNSRVTNSRQGPTIDREPVLSEDDLEGWLMSWKYVDM
jgi:hypothetical protein